MIVFGPFPHLVSAPEAAADSWLPRIGWQNRLRGRPASAAVASSETVDGPSDAPLRHDTGTFWEPSTLPATWTADLGFIYEDIDYVGVVATLGSKSCGVKVETSIDGITFQLMGEAMPPDDTPLMFISAARAAKYVRLTVYGAARPRISVVYIGKLLVMDRGLQMGFGPPNLSRVTKMRTAISRGGQILGQAIREMGVHCEPNFTHLPHDWYRTDFDPFVKSARLYPYFFAWQASNYPYEVAYGLTNEDFAPHYTEQGRFDVAWKFNGVGNL